VSLIIDAIKEAQQHRLKKSAGAPFFRGRGSKRSEGHAKRNLFWIFLLAGLCIFFLTSFLINHPTSSQISPRPQTVRLADGRGSSISETRNVEPQGSKNNDLAPSRMEEYPQVGKSTVQPPLRSHSKLEERWASPSMNAASHFGMQKPSAPIPLVPKEKKAEPIQPLPQQKAEKTKLLPVEQDKKMREEERTSPPLTSQNQAKKIETPKKMISESGSSPPSTFAEEVALPVSSIDLDQAGRRDVSLAKEILTQFNLGVHFQNQRDILRAIQAYQKVIELDPLHVEAYNNLGLIYQQMGDLDRALEMYRKSTDINPLYEKAYNNLGILFYLKDRPEEAMEAFQKALAINPNNIESHINLGILYKTRGHMDKAIECYQKALYINPLHAETHYNIGLLYEQAETSELAISHYQTFVQLASKSHPDLVMKVRRHLDYLIATQRTKKK
jgi:tetratricopeptide (TPR) repeat protein